VLLARTRGASGTARRQRRRARRHRPPGTQRPRRQSSPVPRTGRLTFARLIGTPCLPRRSLEQRTRFPAAW
jgi:hypothetical protein